MKVKNICDHKKLGNKLKLFFFYKRFNNNLPIFLSSGLFIINKIKNFLKKINLKNNYEEVMTPYIGNFNLYKKSGHLDKYSRKMFQIKDKKKNYLKPMNCPYHCLILKNLNNISYKKFPIRIFEFGTVFRNELSGELNGLFRLKHFTQDDGHIFCKNIKEVKCEIKKIINIIFIIYKKFNLNNYFIRLSLRNFKKNKNYIGKKKIWIKSENLLKQILKKVKYKYKKKIYIKYGEAAFYGPKIDFIIKDNLNRKWQVSTIQLDYNISKKFKILYNNKQNILKYPILIHRALIGSIERFLGILLEYNYGLLPIWLLKIQLIIIPINKKFLNYSINIKKYFFKKKVRVNIDIEYDNLNNKIKKYEKLKIPFIFIIGNKEKKNNSIYIRDIFNNKIGEYKKKYIYKYILKKIKNN
ncbi:MAG: threonine--tRNA ligase [Candidatus Shikimatogenerans sp. JK-2022]|nr:threonine--tRNA ligase [Candidatus Shikimatogenerans bostrichidophilus]